MEEGRDAKKKRSLAVTSSTAAAGGGVGLTDDLIVDIISRAPLKSICHFKCVSPSWRDLISHPDNGKKLPQTLTGFFYFDEEFGSCSFVGLVEPPRRVRGRLRPPSPGDFAFLPANTGGGAVDCCNGLVLLNYKGGSGSGSSSLPRALFIVCNPATEKWTTVPKSTRRAGKQNCIATILCFDPSVSEHFHVVRLLEEDEELGYPRADTLFEGFEIYSSETGSWVLHRHRMRWSPCAHRSRRTYFYGLLHFVTQDGHLVAAMDMKGKTRRVIPFSLPRNGEVEFIGHSQGRLFYAIRDDLNTHKLSIYVLKEDVILWEGHDRWTLKHCVDTSGLFADADEYLQSGLLVGVAAIHPHCNSVFLFDALQGRLMAYNMDNQRGRVIRSVTETPLWAFVPYVPHYLETPALGNSN